MKKLTKKRGVPPVTEILSIEIKINTPDFYEYDAFIQTKANIRKLLKENPVLQRLANGELA